MRAFYFDVQVHTCTHVVCVFHFMIKISFTRFKHNWMIRVHPWLNHTCSRELKACCPTHGGLNRWWNNRFMDDCEECRLKIGTSLWCKLSHVRRSGECSFFAFNWSFVVNLDFSKNQCFSSLPLFHDPDGLVSLYAKLH